MGGFPDTGAGSTDLYQIYGNLFFHNPREALLQAEGRVSIHDNVFVDGSFAAINVSSTKSPVKVAYVYNNTFYTPDYGVYFGTTPTVDNSVTGNLFFSGGAIVGPATASNNIADTFANAGLYVNAPSLTLGAMDFYPRAGMATGPALDLFEVHRRYGVCARLQRRLQRRERDLPRRVCGRREPGLAVAGSDQAGGRRSIGVSEWFRVPAVDGDVEGNSVQCAVSLTAPAGATLVAISAGAALTVPASVAIAAGAASVSFPATAGTVSFSQAVSVTATLGGVSLSQSVARQSAAGRARRVIGRLYAGDAALRRRGELHGGPDLPGAVKGSVSLSSGNPALSAPASAPVSAGSPSTTTPAVSSP